ncbi:MAG: YvcK family protein [Candidatus Tectomicrobia bacterium]|nr:YvcK family protein [Candidatus Tectomicrobia bacterium]
MHIVTLGSGTGQATLLRGLREYPCQVTAIVGVTDNGGHSGQLRKQLRIPQVGDTRQCLAALADGESPWGRLLRHRFAQGNLEGVSVGNLVLAALTAEHGSLNAAAADIREAAGLAHRVLPVSDGDAQIGAELEDGCLVIGEWQIIQRRPDSPVKRLFLQPPTAAHAAVSEAISAADLLVVCAGSLLTGVIPVLLHAGVKEALCRSRAPIVQVLNLMTQPGQTDGYTARRHLAALRPYLGRSVDAVLVNDAPLPADLMRVYEPQGGLPVANDLTENDALLIAADLVEHPDPDSLRAYTRPQAAGMRVGMHLVRHDARKLAARIMAFAGRHSFLTASRRAKYDATASQSPPHHR